MDHKYMPRNNSSEEIINMLNKGKNGRIFYKGTVGELLEALKSALPENEEKNLVEINEAPDFEQIEKADMSEATEMSGERVYRPKINRQENLGNESDTNKLLLKEHMKDLKRIDILTSVIEEYTMEVKSLREKISMLEYKINNA